LTGDHDPALIEMAILYCGLAFLPVMVVFLYRQIRISARDAAVMEIQKAKLTIQQETIAAAAAKQVRYLTCHDKLTGLL